MNVKEAAAQRADRLLDSKYLLAFAIVTSLFFSWALAASLNDVLIRQFRKALDLSRLEASLVQFAFYIGYFCAALPAGLAVRRFGHKAAMLGGLALYAAGALMFWPAAQAASYPMFLAALYAIAVGLATLETAANPFIASLGDPSRASARLNLAQAFYGVGAITGGLAGAFLIFTGPEYTPERIDAMEPAVAAAIRGAEAAKVVPPYLIIAALMVVIAIILALTRFPPVRRADASHSRRSPWQVLRSSRLLRAAVLAQACYVAGQVAVWSFFIDFVKDQTPATSESDAALLLSATLGLLTIGRFAGASLTSRFRPHRLLAVYAAINVMLCGFAATASGWPAVIALLSTSFFMSIMYPTIFTLGIGELGEDRDVGAGFLVMAIIGGALSPPLVATVADAAGRVHGAMWIPAACFAVCMGFALLAPRLASPHPAPLHPYSPHPLNGEE